MNNRNSHSEEQIGTAVKSFWGDAAYIPLFLAVFTAFIFTIGYLVETVSLEKFGLYNSELMPDTTTAITLGFRYVLLNSAAFLVVCCIYLITLLLALPSIKSTFDDLPKVKEWLDWSSKKFAGIISVYKPLKSLFLIILITIIPIVIWWNAIDSAGIEATKLIEVDDDVDTLILKGKTPVTVKGRVLRVRNGVLIFRDYTRQTTSLYPLSEVTRIEYFNNLSTK